MTNRARFAVLAAALGLLSAGCASCGSGASSPLSSSAVASSAVNPLNVSAAGFPGAWPLTVPSAVIVCGTINAASVGVNVKGTVYGLNSSAQISEGWPAPNPVWASAPTAPGDHLSLADLLAYGTRVCGAS